MKTRFSFLLAGLFLVLLSGCISSIHPFYTSKDLAFDPLLVGEWFDKNNSNRWVFESTADSSYTMTYHENGIILDTSAITISEFEVHLVNLDGHYFLDLYPGENNHIKMSTLLATTVLPVHLFAKLEYIDGEYLVSFLNGEWLKKSIADKKIDIAYEKTNEQIVLTASTQDLQKMVLQNVDNEEAFIEPTTLVKAKK